MVKVNVRSRPDGRPLRAAKGYSGTREERREVAIPDHRLVDSANGALKGHGPTRHLHFAHGGLADFRGRHNTFYSFFSAPGFAVNVKTENSTFLLKNLYNLGGTLVVNGSFITEIHVVALLGGPKRKPFLASFWASELNQYNTGENMMNGTCGRGLFFLGTGAAKKCEEMAVHVHYSSATFSVTDWSVKVCPAPAGGRDPHVREAW